MRGQSAFLVACLFAALASLARPASSSAPSHAGFPGWPDEFEGRLLVPVALEKRERTFYEAFPGRVARFRDGDRQIILRWVSEETHLMHPAATCFRGRGFEIEPRDGVVGVDGRRWGAFRATRSGVAFDVREIIYCEHQSWADVSAWYWSATLGRTSGPWWAAMIAE